MNLKECAVCGAGVARGYYLASVQEGYTRAFCCKAHLVEFVAPELQKAVVVKQWVPTPEEEKKMSE